MFFNERSEKWKVAVVSAHPDDETLGAGGTLARHVAFGDEVHSCIVTAGYTPDWTETEIKNARLQAEKAMKTLGVASVRFLGFPTVKLNAVPGKELCDKLREFIVDIEPDIIYAPFHGDLNNDHHIVARATATAARPGSQKRITMLYFETLSSTEWGRMFLNTSFVPNIYVDIGMTIEKKLEAASCYSLEMREYPHPRSIEGIRLLAQLRGMEVGLELAEAFMLAVHLS
ncbi:MAG: PIG-L family deacetylase [Actinobacteria bacterium]|nr:PIG-L family deacetylase [Actinomycetota bacterium]